MPGPKPTPTATLERRGSWRAKERESEPTPPVPTAVPVPENLPERATELWEALAPGLHKAGLLTTADLHTFSRYVRTYAQWERVMSKVEEADEVKRNDVLTLSKLSDDLRRLEANYGLTPADRVGLSVDETEDDGKARFFGKRAS